MEIPVPFAKVPAFKFRFVRVLVEVVVNDVLARAIVRVPSAPPAKEISEGRVPVPLMIKVDADVVDKSSGVDGP